MAKTPVGISAGVLSWGPRRRETTAKNRFTFEKRAKEIARQQKQAEKLERRQNKDQSKPEAPESDPPDEQVS
jgi:hypothetical protein